MDRPVTETEVLSNRGGVSDPINREVRLSAAHFNYILTTSESGKGGWFEIAQFVIGSNQIPYLLCSDPRQAQRLDPAKPVPT